MLQRHQHQQHHIISIQIFRVYFISKTIIELGFLRIMLTTDIIISIEIVVITNRFWCIKCAKLQSIIHLYISLAHWNKRLCRYGVILCYVFWSWAKATNESNTMKFIHNNAFNRNGKNTRVLRNWFNLTLYKRVIAKSRNDIRTKKKKTILFQLQMMQFNQGWNYHVETAKIVQIVKTTIWTIFCLFSK